MKISRIEVYQVDLPYAGGVYLLSGGREYRSFDASIIHMVTDDGTEGWGESTPFGSTYIAAHARGVRAGVAEIAPYLIGRDPRQVDRINEVMDQALVGHNHAKAALDIACWDIFGKSVSRPVCELLGGSTNLRMPIISSIYAGEPDAMRARVAEHRARGYRGHSIKIGASDREGGPALDAERIKASLADRRPGEYFLVDANGGLLPETALRMLRMVPQDLDFVLEAPCATWRETLSLRQRCSVPIVLDELVQHGRRHRAIDCAGRSRRYRIENFEGGRPFRRTSAAGYRFGGRSDNQCSGYGGFSIGLCRNRASGSDRAGTELALCSRLP